LGSRSPSLATSQLSCQTRAARLFEPSRSAVAKSVDATGENWCPRPARTLRAAPPRRLSARWYGPVGRHRVPGVGEPDDRSLERDRLAGEAVRVAEPSQRSWWCLMIGTASRRRPNFPTIRAPSAGVRLHLGVLPVVELRRLDENPVGHGDLADVVEQRAEAQRVELLGRQVELCRDREGDALHTQRVAGRVGVFRLDGCVQALDRLERALLEPLVRGEQVALALAELPASAAVRVFEAPRTSRASAAQSARKTPATVIQIMFRREASVCSSPFGSA
jgi:hypothetical protein